MHQDRFYTQTDGVAMGNPLGATLETTKFDKFPGFKPKLYLRYVDDVFLL